MKPKFNFWLEKNGEVVLSIWRVQLLEAVREAGSISGGAAVMNVPYRVAWQKIHEMETRLGQKLVETQIGGADGGGARLTPLAESYIQKFNQFQQETQADLQSQFDKAFSE
ncbi:MAG: LysR family transcriptional regulator [Candidatus Promineifilaceae bacterium]